MLGIDRRQGEKMQINGITRGEKLFIISMLMDSRNGAFSSKQKSIVKEIDLVINKFRTNGDTVHLKGKYLNALLDLIKGSGKFLKNFMRDPKCEEDQAKMIKIMLKDAISLYRKIKVKVVEGKDQQLKEMCATVTDYVKREMKE